MTKKDYVALAHAFSQERKRVDHSATHGTEEDRTRAHGAWAALDAMALRVADVCGRDNARFDRAKFLAACQEEG